MGSWLGHIAGNFFGLRKGPVGNARLLINALLFQTNVEFTIIRSFMRRLTGIAFAVPTESSLSARSSVAPTVGGSSVALLLSLLLLLLLFRHGFFQ